MKRVAVLFLSFVFITAIAAQTAEENFNVDETYTSLFRYQGKEGDFLIFYDEKGVMVFLRYRIDRWDSEAENRVSDLRQGAQYRITWKFLGYRSLKDGTFQGITTEKDAPSRIRKIKNVPYGAYVSHQAVLPEKILL